VGAGAHDQPAAAEQMMASKVGLLCTFITTSQIDNFF
jgi:hypothetical protein